MGSCLNRLLRPAPWLPVLVATLAAAQPQPVRIGHVAATSGWMSVVGIESENAARLAIERLNAAGTVIGGRTVRFELVSADDVGSAARAVTAAQALVAAAVHGVVGHLTSGATLAAVRTYVDAGVPLVVPAATHPLLTRSGWPRVFRLVADDTEVGRRLGRHAVEQLQARRFAVIDDGSTYGSGAAASFTQAVAESGGRVVLSRTTSADSGDFAAFLDAVKAEQADAVFIGGMEPQAGRLLQQMKQRGIGARLIGGDAICTPDLVSYYARGEADDDQVLCPLPGGVPALADAATASFAAAYAQRFGAEPAFYAAHAYDGVMLIAQAMVRAGSSDPARYAPALAATRSWRGVSGIVGFDAKGDRIDPVLGLFTYRAEKRRLIGIAR